MLRCCKTIRCPHCLSEDGSLELVWLLMHQHCFGGVLQVGRKEGLGVSITIHLNRIVLDRNSQDMANRAENWKLFLIEEEGSPACINVNVARYRDHISAALG
jgi:hypothetical protein